MKDEEANWFPIVKGVSKRVTIHQSHWDKYKKNPRKERLPRTEIDHPYPTRKKNSHHDPHHDHQSGLNPDLHHHQNPNCDHVVDLNVNAPNRIIPLLLIMEEIKKNLV